MSNTSSFRGLVDRVIVVTGGGSGIGRSVAERFADERAHVAILDIDFQAAETVARSERMNGRARAWECDVTNEEAVRKTFLAVERHFGAGMNVLVANAGIEGPVGFLPDIELEDWERVVTVNLTGQFLCAKYAIPAMKKQRGGSIIFTASNSSFTVNPKWGAYTATKGAVLMLARSLAVDHAPDNIRVNCVCPGAIDTPLLHRGYLKGGEGSEGVDKLRRTRGRLGKPEEIAGLVAFLASEDATLMTGAAVVADGGSMLRQGPTWPSDLYWE
jgi:NAD(P)-dependent dehydrogenase (short-subunit alcohol dehydrogenase family)